MTRRIAVKVWTWKRAFRDHGPKKQGLLLTLHTISTYMDGDGYAFPSQDLLAEVMGISRRTVIRHIQMAHELGWLAIEQQKGTKGYRHNVYYATVPAIVELSEVDESLTDRLHSQCGDIGEEYENHVTSVTDHVTPVTEPCDTRDQNHVTQYCHTKEPVNSPYNSTTIEGTVEPFPSDFLDSEDRETEEPVGEAEDLSRLRAALQTVTTNGATNTIGSVLQGSVKAAAKANGEARIKRAIELLEGGKFKPKEIAVICGIPEFHLSRLRATS